MEAASDEAQPPRAPLSVDQPSKRSSLVGRLFNATTPSSDATGTSGSGPGNENGNLENGAGAAGNSVIPPKPFDPESSAVPPYWRHYRKVSQASQTSVDASGKPLITLEDHTEDSFDPNRGLWAKSVSVDDYIVVNGESRIGAYVVWTCKIETLSGVPLIVRMRYSEFDHLRRRLAAAFPHAKKSMPSLPPKSPFFKFNPRFLESRRSGLAYFLNCVLLNPEFAGSPILKETLFSHSS